MIYNYVIFDANGLLSDSELHPISQGNNNVDRFNIAFADYDYTNTYITVAVTLPDGNTLPELATSIKEFTFKNVTYKGYNFTVSEPLTAQAGVLTFTISLKSKEDDDRLCTSRLNITIYDTDVPVEPTITKAQLENLMTTIDNTGKELDDIKISRYFEKYPNKPEVNGNEILVANQSIVDSGNVCTIRLKDAYNITSINGLEPVDRKIELTAENIPYADSTTAETLTNTINDLNNKVNYREGVMHRSGVIIQGEVETSEYKGMLPYTYIKNDPNQKDNVAVVKEGGYKFKYGDILNIDLELSIGGGTGTINISKIMNNMSGIPEKYRVPIFTHAGDPHQLGNMYLSYCEYTLAMDYNEIKITGTYLKTLQYSGEPIVTLHNISILRT